MAAWFRQKCANANKTQPIVWRFLFKGLAAESSPMIAVVAYGLVTVREAPQRTIETQRVVNGIAAQRSTQNRWLIPVWIRSEKAQTQTIYIYGVFALKVLPR